MAKRKNSDNPAFPGSYATVDDALTKREYFAGMAMQAILSNPFYGERFKVNDYWVDGKTISAIAVDCADALLAELENK